MKHPQNPNPPQGRKPCPRWAKALHHLRTLGLALTATVLVACGGGGGGEPPEVLKGRFVDAPVAGLTYQTESRTGKTDAEGYFEYDKAGETIQFSVGSLPVGSAQTAPQVHVYDLSGDEEDRYNGKNIRVAQLLQSLDTNKGVGEVIQLPADVDNKISDPSSLSLKGTQAEYDAALKKMLDKWEDVKTLVSAETAKARADAYVASTLTDCPVPVPPKYHWLKNPEKLSCIDRARVSYYVNVVNPLFANAVSDNAAQSGLVEETWNEKAVSDAIDASPFIAVFESFDSIIGVVDSAAKGEIYKTAGKATEAMGKFVRTVISFRQYRDIAIGKSMDEAKKVREIADISQKMLDALSNSTQCASFFATENDGDLSSCAKLVSNIIDTNAKVNKDLCTTNTMTVHKSVTIEIQI